MPYAQHLLPGSPPFAAHGVGRIVRRTLLWAALILVLSGFFLVLSAMISVEAAPQSAALALACAQRDLRAVVLIEERGSAQDIAASKLAAAHQVVLRARELCQHDRAAEALRMYDGHVLLHVLAKHRN
jgi:hypothetical protein